MWICYDPERNPKHFRYGSEFRLSMFEVSLKKKSHKNVININSLLVYQARRRYRTSWSRSHTRERKLEQEELG